MVRKYLRKWFGQNKEIKRDELINMLISHFSYRRYLEIGVNDSANFLKIKCDDKTSVDPAEGIYAHAEPTHRLTSDNFFETIAPTEEKYDIVFIDGLHHYEQVSRDIENSLRFLNDRGSIVLHDCNPKKEIHQKVPRESVLWNGDVWKAIVEFRDKNREYGCLVIDSDYGLGWISKSIPVSERFNYKLNYKSLKRNRKKYLNLVKPNNFNINNYK